MFIGALGVSMVLALIPSVSGAAGAGAAAPRAAKPVVGGTWTVGISTEVPTLDPLRSVSTLTGGDRSLLIFDSLMKLDPKSGAIVPGLALSLTSSDAVTWTLKLRPNLKFTDGTPLDAEAVIFNYTRLKDPANTYQNIGLVSQISKMTAIDPTTVEFKLAQANGSFGLSFTDSGGQMGSPTAIKADPRTWGQKPVGAGPFMLKEWVRDQQVTLVRNPNYFDKPKPYIDSIVFKIIPDKATQAALLKAGSIDQIDSADSAAQLQVATDDPKNFRTENLAIGRGVVGLGCNLDRVPCNDIRFREALSLAFDFDLVKQVFLAGIPYNAKTLVCPPFGPGNPFCSPNQKGIKFNPTRAKKLVDAVKADGINTDIVFTFNSLGVLGVRLGEFVQQQLAKIGVKVEPRSVSTAEYIGITTQRTFQTSVVYNVPAPDFGTRFYNDWHSVGGPNGGRDVLAFNNAQLDVALEKGRNSLKLADKAEGWREAQDIIGDQFLVQWFAPVIQVAVYKTTLKLPPVPEGLTGSFRYTDLWIKKTR